MWFLCGFIAGAMELICQIFKEEAEKDGHAECWTDFNSDVCSWADLFGTATIMFLIMLLIEISTSIVDCSALCCCPPDDAHWSQKAQAQQANQAPGDKPGTVIGQPIAVKPDAQPVTTD